MKIFHCPGCRADLYFDNLACSCGLEVGYDPAAQSFTGSQHFCANRDSIGCNWIAAPDQPLCESCGMTSMHPDLSVPGNEMHWARAEAAKRHVLAGLMRWGWFTAGDSGPRPEFHMLAEATSQGAVDVTMGHAAGLVTINLAEADALERVRRREMLGEPYRTLIGHFRHEIAHFLFERLSGRGSFLADFRALFGDERQDYRAALARHYADGPPPDWQSAHVTAYAAAHPHEDWAESAAHAMHLTDLTDSFCAAGLGLGDVIAQGYDAFRDTDPARLLDRAIAIGVAMNHVNRAVGQPDIYPFVNTAVAREKLGFALGWLSA
ncbi:zinc-binding metallopeptidase family protein [Natronohydrobacter thiooxidans]|uniref:zinc-binding metallopeptidase family protein n=1 Tax=Natronohydrobacter thiooxidans TaxID=87172 RepID=UPI0008FF4D81|nr:putative zinc-binding metallopeptidase [Natronohydrobacter thiooxidans]